MRRIRKRSRGSLWSSCTSVSAAKRRLRRWDRYITRCEKIVGPTHLSLPGWEKAWNRYAGAVNYRNNQGGS